MSELDYKYAKIKYTEKRRRVKSLEKLQFHRRPGERRGPGRVEDGSVAAGRADG